MLPKVRRFLSVLSGEHCHRVTEAGAGRLFFVSASPWPFLILRGTMGERERRNWQAIWRLEESDRRLDLAFAWIDRLYVRWGWRDPPANASKVSKYAPRGRHYQADARRRNGKG